MVKNFQLLALVLLIPSLQAKTPNCPQPRVLAPEREEMIEDLVSEIVVSARDPRDPCRFEAYSGHLGTEIPGLASWSVTIDKSFVAGRVCKGRLVEGLCYLQDRTINASTGSTRYREDRDNGGVAVTIASKGECKWGSCAYPLEAPLNFLVPFENIYDGQGREQLIYDCDPANCYSIHVDLADRGKENPGDHVITVTRGQDGEISTRMYVNVLLPFSSSVTLDGIIDDDDSEGARPELLGRKPDTFASCNDPYPRRVPPPVLPRLDLYKNSF